MHKKKMNLEKWRTGEKQGSLTYYLFKFDFKLIYNSGKNNLEADC